MEKMEIAGKLVLKADTPWRMCGYRYCPIIENLHKGNIQQPKNCENI